MIIQASDERLPRVGGRLPTPDTTPEIPGFYEVVSMAYGACTVTAISHTWDRLNLTDEKLDFCG
jgi:hypothetical protein